MQSSGACRCCPISRHLFERLPIGAYRSSPDGRQLRANAALVRLNGYEGEVAEMLAAVNDIGREWYVDPAQRRVRPPARGATATSSTSSRDLPPPNPRAHLDPENAHVVRDVDGEVLFYEGTVEDITAERATGSRWRRTSGASVRP